MAETHVISALVAKRSELAGLVDHHRKEAARLLQDVKLLDATIKLFEPEFSTDLIKPKRHQKRNLYFKHGEAHRMVLDILRESGKPLSTKEIAQEAKFRKGLTEVNERDFQATILTILGRQKKSGLVVNIGKDDAGGCVWDLA
jgi:hypothetical protein